ncbi:MAG TPA: hypothetical protein VME40_02590 [Caulobacteraceae bacterium]|nr:hypothetical protein [Caulobacteraceae bacterium]
MKHPIFAAAFAGALAVASVASAQPAGGGGGGGVRQACAADIQKACPDAKPGPGGGMRECIRDHWDQLSDGCRAAITKMRAQRQQQGGGQGGGRGGGQ